MASLVAGMSFGSPNARAKYPASLAADVSQSGQPKCFNNSDLLLLLRWRASHPNRTDAINRMRNTVCYVGESSADVPGE